MSIIAQAVRHMLAADMPHEKIIAAITDMENADKPKSSGAIRQARYRERLNERNSDVTLRHSVTPPSNGSDGFPYPSLTSLTTPKENTPKGVQKKVPQDQIIIPDWLPLSEWIGFKEMRMKIKKPMTGRAERLAIGKLEKFRSKGHDPTEILNQSILNDYQDLYEPRKSHANIGTNHGKNNGNGHEQRSIDEPKQSKWLIEGDRLAAKYRAEAERERQRNASQNTG